MAFTLAFSAAQAAKMTANQPFKPSVTEHSIQLGTSKLNYQATVGLKPIYDSKHELLATMSYIAYAKKDEKHRPITFVWSGGPGNSTLPSNLLVSGPKIIDVGDKQKVKANLTTWLRFTDLVYIDISGSGWGRPSSEGAKKFIYTPEGDAYTFSEFIKAYLMDKHRVKDPIFLSGVSYGGYRLPLVARNLLKNMVPIRGYILQSPLLRLSYSYSSYGNFEPYIFAFPTYIHAALHYQKLASDAQQDPQKTIEEGTKWVLHEYPYYLFRGDKLTHEEKLQLTNTIHRYTGLSKKVIEANHYRIDMDTFREQLLKSTNRVVDYTDATLPAKKLTDKYGFYPFTMTSFLNTTLLPNPVSINHIKTELKASATGFYVNYFDPQTVWDWRSTAPQQVISVLRDVLTIDNRSTLFLGVGYFDTDIPYKVSEVAINQLFLADKSQDRVETHEYNGGHMFSSNPAIRDQFNNDVMKFFSDALRS